MKVLPPRKSIFEVQKSEGAEDMIITIAPDVWAIGSGCDFALSAMKLGKNAKEAVESVEDKSLSVSRVSNDANIIKLRYIAAY